MAKCETGAEIDDVAALWTARLDRGALQPHEEQELQAWLDRDPRRLGALARAQAVMIRVEGLQAFTDAAVANPSVAEAAAPEAQRRKWRSHWNVGALAATLVAAILITMLLGRADPLTTRLGEVRLVPLPDGSAIVLNTASRVRTDFTASQRSVELVSGEALFNVAKDSSRPFIVTAGDTRVRAVGTSFSVRRMPDDSVRVLVREGVVQIDRGSSSRQEPISVRAEANTRVLAPPGHGAIVQPATSPEVVRELVWREGVISFDGVTLQQAADEFARYSKVRIGFANAAIGTRKITGLFAANDPVGFARAVALSLNLQADVDGESVTLR